jgi:hypothetical protein
MSDSVEFLPRRIPPTGYPWDRLHVGYFSAYSLWVYTSILFFALPGFKCAEIEPWQKNGEV